jgi:hypothetical protein
VGTLRRVAAFWYDFVVGDDWTISAAVVGALAALALLARDGTAPWWLLPVVVAFALWASLWRAARPRGAPA